MLGFLTKKDDTVSATESTLPAAELSRVAVEPSSELLEMVSIFAEASAAPTSEAQPNPKFNPFRGASAPVPELISADSSLSQYPHEMSCPQVFDLLVGCFSLGGQVRSFYRYGTMANCDEQLAKFKFCMTTSTKSAADKEKEISQWYKESWARRKAAGSSEDVWEARK